ncbi:MAG: hypothetical protein LIO85_06085 [Rikenellaceae bacterium]|nr:hypothetical protein [Rikenellaceae bacterium]
MTIGHLSKQIVTLALLAAAFTAVRAQEPEADRDLDRRVDVSREYMPDMDRAAKLTIRPVMNDTVSLRPELEYTVVPAPWYTGFGVAAINPVRVDASSYEQLLPFYLKAGFGGPSRSFLDMYGTTTSTSGGYAGGYITHKGEWSKLRNEMDVKARGLESHNSVGVFGRTYLGRRLGLSGEIGYNYDIYSRYGFTQYYDAIQSTNGRLLSYSVPRAAVRIGHDFTDMDRFNFAVGAEGYLLRDREDNKETGIDVSLGIGKRFGIHELRLDMAYGAAFGSGNLDAYDLTVVGFTPSYRVKGAKLEIGAHVEVAYNKLKDSNTENSSKTLFLPSADVVWRIDHAFAPFALLRSRAITNSYREMTSRNPYLSTVMFLPTRDYSIVAGFRGDVMSNFSYEVRAGGGFMKNAFYNLYSDSGYFTPLAYDKRLKYFTAGTSLTGRISEKFSAGLEADYFNYSQDELENTLDMPEFKGDIFLRYNYRSKLFLKLTGGLTGTRYFGFPETLWVGGIPNVEVESEKQKAVFDLGLEAEYRLTGNLGIWIAGENLLNRKLYPYYNYRGFGISVTAGVKLMF